MDFLTNHSRKILSFALLLAHVATMGQGVLTFDCHVPRHGDRVTTIEVESLSTESSVSDQTVWDFSHAVATGSRPVVRYANWGDTLVVRYDRDRQFVYGLCGDSVRCVGQEYAFAGLRDTLRAHVLRYPLSLGDSVSSPFHLEGDYCHSNALFWSGTLTTVADALGTLILPDDTITDALRVRQVREGAVWIGRGLDRPSFVEVEGLPLCRQERFLWYSSRSRYPVAEVETETFLSSGGDVVREMSTSRLCPPSLQEYELEPPRCSRPRSAPPVSTASGSSSGGDLLAARISEIEVNVEGSQAVFSYSLIDGDGTVEALLCDSQGRVYGSMPPRVEPSGRHCHSLSTEGLPSGTYLISVRTGNDRAVRHFIVK